MEQTRPDGFVLGVDPAQGKDETIIQVSGGCARCHREWPAVTFKKVAGAAFLNDPTLPMPKEGMLCDRCFDRNPEIDKAIEEATTGTVPGLIRSVEVTGIESKTNVASFKYATHLGGVALIVTDVLVTFAGKDPAKKPSRYLYMRVPILICEAWMGSPSMGRYFIEQIKSSYDFKRIESEQTIP